VSSVASSAAAAPAPQQPKPKPKRFYASIHPGPKAPLPQPFVELIQSLEQSIGIPLWLLIQRSDGEGLYGQVDDGLRKAFLDARAEFVPGEEVGLLIDSPGGQARSAFQIAKLLRRHCGGFAAVVPRYAKSAATLLTLGAERLFLNSEAELGPLDAQIFDPEREDFSSALDEVQSLERLHAFSLEAIDQTMIFVLSRTHKKVDRVLPQAMHFVSEMIKPLFEKIDVVHYTQRARVLKVAEEYAIRLLTPRYSKRDAERIARRLVEKYPEHGFVIDKDELTDPGELLDLGLNMEIEELTDEQTRIMNEMMPFLGQFSVIGKLREVQSP